MLKLTYRYKNNYGVEQVFTVKGWELTLGRKRVYSTKFKPHDVLIGEKLDLTTLLQTVELAPPVANLLDLTPDKAVSHQHARLFYNLSTWWVEDFGSKNRTRLNGQYLEPYQAKMLSPGDKLTIGETIIRVDFTPPADEATAELSLVNTLSVWEEREPEQLQALERSNLQLLSQFIELIQHSQGQQSLLDLVLIYLGILFPQASLRSILVVEGKELVPRVFYPTDRARFSFRLARQALLSRQLMHWQQPEAFLPSDNSIANSLAQSGSALYSPLICNDQSLGVIHLATNNPLTAFSSAEILLLRSLTSIVAGELESRSSATLVKLPQVFLSYAREDRAMVDRLAADLRKRRIKVWYDSLLEGGQNWQKHIELALLTCDTLLLIVSPQSVQSPYVKAEIETALEQGKSVIPLVYEKTELPQALQHYQYLHIGDESRYQASLEELATIIKNKAS